VCPRRGHRGQAFTPRCVVQPPMYQHLRRTVRRRIFDSSWHCRASRPTSQYSLHLCLSETNRNRNSGFECGHLEFVPANKVRTMRFAPTQTKQGSTRRNSNPVNHCCVHFLLPLDPLDDQFLQRWLLFSARTTPRSRFLVHSDRRGAACAVGETSRR
jgi:hypothetical protein